jgi:hypothetical protein
MVTETITFHRRFLVASDPQTLATEWGSLPEADRQYTRGQVAMWPKMLAMAGFEIIKRAEGSVEKAALAQS